MSSRLLGNVLFKGQIECLTGLHVGGTEEKYEIGGMDNPVIREPVSGFPYIPGSSLKGKMRSILEWVHGKVGETGEPCGCAKCPICRVFGPGSRAKPEERRNGPTRLTVRDAFPSERTKQAMLRLREEKGLPYVEIKSENCLDRITSKADLRSLERVPVGSRFGMGMVYGVYQLNGDWETDVECLRHVFEAMLLLEDSTLGGGGSRGSGQIQFFVKKGYPLLRAVKKEYEPQPEGNSPAAQEDPGEFEPLRQFDLEEFMSRLKKEVGSVAEGAAEEGR